MKSLCISLFNPWFHGGILQRRITSGIFFGMWWCTPRLRSMAGYQSQKSRCHIWSPKKGKITWFEDLNVHPYWRYLNIHQMPAHASFLAWQAHYDLKDPAGLAGFLIDSDIKLVRAEFGSSEESSRHSKSRRLEKKWDAKCRQDEVSNCSIVFFLFVFFFTLRVGMVWSSVGLHSWVWLESGYGKYLVGGDSRYLTSLLKADGRFPRRQEAETTTFTDAAGASRSALVSHEEVQAWADECHDCRNLTKTSPVSAWILSLIKLWTFKKGTGNFGGLKDCQIHADPNNDPVNSIGTEFTAALCRTAKRQLPDRLRCQDNVILS